MLTSATRGETLTPNPNECNSTLTSGTNNIYPYPYMDVNDRGHRFRSGSPLTNYPHAPAGEACVPGLAYCLVGTGISSGSITDQSPTIRRVRRCKILKYMKSGLDDSLDDGACHKRSLVGAGWSDLWARGG